jgi:DNA excision repair protein ERCC-2
LIGACLSKVPGNVAIYFSSYAMRDDIMARVDLGGRRLLSQPHDLDPSDRDAWLEPLRSSKKPVVLAAVLGGVFAEGIDLPHGALHGVFVVGPGFPPVGLERDLLRAHYESRYGEGHRYASQIPGLTRVTQAVGRLIRRPEDRGIVVLFGRRFRWREVQTLLPEAWGMQIAEDPVRRIEQFFEDGP